jgi:hypothetical protein
VSGPTKTIAVYADTRGVAVCRGRTCRQSITWAEVVGSGKRMCFTGEPVPLRTEQDAAGRLIEVLAFDDNHWATCPDRETFRRPKA